jgi:hypothetical protein
MIDWTRKAGKRRDAPQQKLHSGPMSAEFDLGAAKSGEGQEPRPVGMPTVGELLPCNLNFDLLVRPSVIHSLPFVARKDWDIWQFVWPIEKRGETESPKMALG